MGVTPMLTDPAAQPILYERLLTKKDCEGAEQSALTE